MKRKGIVFTLDAVFAIYMGLLFMTTYLMLMDMYYEPTTNIMPLSRIARDYHESDYYLSQLTVTDSMDIDGYTRNCGETDDIGASTSLKYPKIRLRGYSEEVQAAVPVPSLSQDDIMFTYPNKWYYAGTYERAYQLEYESEYARNVKACVEK